ncbi:hypothetical protein EI546_08770 [Aequorivita sp. H23M31]|uniref:Uncharacterized protein n=1 Tax=Aequorivita ciconiae TaxID=2494375 RepID=A0A410G3L3_9FLAO|nr:DUF6252 family protein [Aequorivita sp. H23M31]QAA81805.1 hypothetical protein EI546_08770 [Aequorivita sp. H23M31]
MKNLVLFLLILISMVSCEDHETNEFAIQAKIGDRLYISTEARASMGEDGGYIIQGSSSSESLTIRLSQLKEDTFMIGEGSSNYATFEDFNGNLFSTLPDGTGSVTISEVDEVNKTLSGIFNFNATLPGIDTIYVSKGVLYNVPYDFGQIDIPGEAGTFSAKINGVPFLPLIVTAVEAGGSIKVAGSKLTESIVLTLPSGVQLGEFQLSDEGYSATYQNEEGMQTSTEGRISITEHDLVTGSLKGTFSFLTDQSEITEGQFEVIY